MDRSKNENRKVIGQLVNSQALSASQIGNAEKALDTELGNSEWLLLIKLIFQWMSAALIGAGSVFFVAANWQGLTDLHKFALIQAPLVVAIGLYIWFSNSTAKKGALLVAFLNIGAAFALFGQVFQTGADPWQLFFNWALLGFPIVLISRSNAIYLMWAGLLNLTLHFYADIYIEYSLSLLLSVGLNAVLLALWEVKQTYSDWITNNWTSNLMATYLVYSAVFCFCVGLFFTQSLTFIAILLPFLVCLLLYFFYRTVRKNLFMLVLVGVFSLVAVNAVFIKLLDNNSIELALLCGVFITAGIGWFWLLHVKSLHREIEKHGIFQ